MDFIAASLLSDNAQPWEIGAQRSQGVLEQPLRDLGAQHVHWGARPEDYLLVREALVRAIQRSSAAWTDTLEDDWRRAITSIAVPMLQGAAVHTAMAAEQLAEEI